MPSVRLLIPDEPDATASPVSPAPPPSRYPNRRFEFEEHGLLIERNRAWNHLCPLNIRYNKRPHLFNELLPQELEGRMSNFVFAKRIQALNELLADENLQDYTRVWQTAFTICFVILVIITIALVHNSSLSVCFSILILITVIWAVAVVGFHRNHPLYEIKVRQLCRIWSENDMHLRLGYLSQRSQFLAPAGSLVESVQRCFVPVEMNWTIWVLESVPLAHHRVSEFSHSTVDTFGYTGLPVYLPAWDSTPAPEYSLTLASAEAGMGSLWSSQERQERPPFHIW
ncbi:hypothetical protein HDU98_002119 [Podochytrium sp. JEL0797]|nr:hypothetical protein HDU98_002119 [Podochytrium sp. JEL0797]